MNVSSRGQDDKHVIYTYRYLRIAMIALMVLFGAVPLTQSLAPGCFLGSISAYYYTPARALFVGSLFGLGACLIAYQGHSDEEEVLLNFTGIMAFIVAVVPAVVDYGYSNCTMIVPPDTVTDKTGITANVIVLSAVGVSAAIVVYFLRKKWNARPLKGRALILAILSMCALGVQAFFFVRWYQEVFVKYMHGIAASGMVLGVLGVIVSHVFISGSSESRV